ncbi:MAG: hypothetical protein H7X95_06560 [Deltaproteobacteria bacterium]|nr:hypothetical protein [Deltaproteobacteria bacterium]
MLYEMVTGGLPFNGDSSESIARQHLHADPVPASELVSGLSWEVEDLLRDMLAKDPGGRPRSARALAGRLARLVLRSQQQ